MLGRQIAFLDGADIRLGLAQVEEQFFLGGGSAQLHHAPRAQDIFLDRRADPPHRIGRQPKALVGFEAFHRLHQPDIAFGHDFGNGQAIAAIAHGDLGDQAQMAGDQAARGLRVFMLLPALGEHVFVFGGQQGKLADLGEIPRQASFARQSGKSTTAHKSPLIRALIDNNA
jgi:hypothetical protein